MRRDAGVDVHHRAAREVENAELGEPAAAPDPVRDRRVDEDRPERDEGEVRPEAHAVDDRAGDQRGGDDGERRLVGHEQHVRDRALRVDAHVIEEREREVAEVVAAGAEGERVAEERPGHAAHAEGGEAHHQRVQRILRPDQAAVEEGDARCHEEHERRGYENPRRVRPDDRGRWRSRGCGGRFLECRHEQGGRAED